MEEGEEDEEAIACHCHGVIPGSWWWDAGFGLCFSQESRKSAGRRAGSLAQHRAGIGGSPGSALHLGFSPTSQVETTESQELLSGTPCLAAVLGQSSHRCCLGLARAGGQGLQILAMCREGEDAKPCVRPELI